MPPRLAILGIDAAWTPTAGSGVALVVGSGASWRCVGLAPSAAEFEGLAAGRPVLWDRKPGPASSLDAVRLVEAARALAPTARLAVVAVDMPLSRNAISGRRPCDDAVSRTFGARGCGTHTPSSVRPGPLSAALRADFGRLGVPLCTASGPSGGSPALLEVYPHTALLALTGSTYRVEYKCSKTLTYWPGEDIRSRQRRLAKVWSSVLARLRSRIEVDLDLPGPRPFSALKRYEDAIDALVCAWVGVEYLSGRATPFGDDDAAIWTPLGG